MSIDIPLDLMSKAVSEVTSVILRKPGVPIEYDDCEIDVKPTRSGWARVTFKFKFRVPKIDT